MLMGSQCQNKIKVDLCLKNDQILNFTAVHGNHFKNIYIFISLVRQEELQLSENKINDV